MSGTKRSRASSTRKTAEGPVVADEVAVLEKGSDAAQVVSLSAEIDDFEDILGEIVEPKQPETVEGLDDVLGELEALPTGEPIDELDDVLSALAEPAPSAPADELDDILGELAEVAGPAPEPQATIQAEPALDLDDLLDAIAEPAQVEPDDPLADILSELAEPTKPEQDLDEILGEVTAPEPAAPKSKTKPKAKAQAAPEPEPAADDLSAMLDEMTPAPAPEPAPAPAAPVAAAKGKGRSRLFGALVPNLQGKREVSRKAHAGLVALAGVMSAAAIGEGAYILFRPAHPPAPPAATVTKVSLIPIDYTKVNLERYIGKTRVLKEGGRDMLRHPQVKAAMVQLNSGETLYREILAIARRSPAADRMIIRDNRVTIASCEGRVCTDSGFRLIYDLRAQQAAVCVTERFANGAMQSFAQGSDGYREVAGCQGIR